MKKLQKLTVLASTLVLSSLLSATADKSFADSEYDINVENNTVESIKENKETIDEKVSNSEETFTDENLVKYSEFDKDQIEKYSIEEEVVEYKSLDQEVNNKVEEKNQEENNEEEFENFTINDVIYYEEIEIDDNYIGPKTNTNTVSEKINTRPENTINPVEEKPAEPEFKEIYKSNDGKFVLKSNGKVSNYYENNQLVTNKDVSINGKYYSIDKDGNASPTVNKWINQNSNKYYINEKGNLAKGITKINNQDYYFNNDGSLVTKTSFVKDNKYYKVSDLGIISNPKNSWAGIGNKTYYTDNNGNLSKGLKTIGKNIYHFNNNGEMETNKFLYAGDRFFNVDSRGVANPIRKQWVKHNGRNYYTNEQGYRCEGVWQIDGVYYNLTPYGKARDYTVVQDGITYQFDKDGKGKIVSTTKPNKDLDVLIGWMYNGMNYGMTYDMGAKRNTKYASDCSSAVYRAMIAGGFIPEGSFIGNTETLFALGREAKVIKEISEKDIRYGDIFVSGIPGKSLGAGGHTGLIVDKNTIIHSNYTDDGISVTNRVGRMGDASGRPVRYYRLVGGSSRKLYI